MDESIGCHDNGNVPFLLLRVDPWPARFRSRARAMNKYIGYPSVVSRTQLSRQRKSPPLVKCISLFFLVFFQQMWMDQNFPAGENRKLHIHGSKTQVDAAIREVEALMASAPVNGAGRQGKMTPEVREEERIRTGGEEGGGWEWGSGCVRFEFFAVFAGFFLCRVATC